MKRRRAKLRLELSGRGQPDAPPSAIEVTTTYVEDGGTLELTPRGLLFKPQNPDAWQVRYHFQVRLRGRACVLEQIADKYGHRLPMGVEPATAQPGPVRLEANYPVTIYFNVPGGGPQWKVTLVGIQ